MLLGSLALSKSKMEPTAFLLGIEYHVLNKRYITLKGEDMWLMNPWSVFQSSPLTEAAHSRFIWMGSTLAVPGQQYSTVSYFKTRIQVDNDEGNIYAQLRKAWLMANSQIVFKGYPGAWMCWFKKFHALSQSWFSITSPAWASIILYTSQPPAAGDKLKAILASVMPQS